MNRTELETLYHEVLRLQTEQPNSDSLRAAKIAASAALREHAAAIADAITERAHNDPTIQGLLTDMWWAVFAAVDQGIHPAGLHSGVMWAGAVEAVFPCPDSAMLEAREAGFREEYGIPSFASIAGA